MLCFFLKEWMQFEEVGDMKEQVSNVFEKKKQSIQKETKASRQVAAKKWPVAFRNEDKNVSSYNIFSLFEIFHAGHVVFKVY